MADSLAERFKNAWNAFIDRKSIEPVSYNIGPSYSTRPDKLRLNYGNERSIISSIYARLSTSVASVNIKHVRLDENERYLETISSGLNRCLSLEANKDQSGRAFIMDVALSMFDEGCVAIVPVDTSINPAVSGSYDILSMRTAKIVEWFPDHIRVNIYNDRTGQKENITLPKRTVAIIENPFYSVMNEPNSTLKRLVYKLNLLDAIDTQSGSGKLDLIVQLPYVIKSDTRREQAEKRRDDIEKQLSGSKYGIAYTDGTEKVTQLNRPVENQLMIQIEYLTRMLYSQLGINEDIINGKADEKVMLNYYKNTVEPIIFAILDGMKRTFLTRTAISQRQSITYFRDAFGLVPASELATISDSFTRNAILSSNEIRGIIGYKPSNDPEADSLRNKNLNPTPTQIDPKGNIPKGEEGVTDDGNEEV